MKPGALFVLPVPPGGWRGPVAPWITTAGWAGAAQRIVGDVWIVTPSGTIGPDDAAAEASRPSLAPRPARRWRRAVPEEGITLVKDVRHALAARRFDRAALEGPWREPDVDLAFVWQRHDLFHRAGVEAARAVGRPLVTFAAAPLVWEAARWGVRRPGFGRLVERWGEIRNLAAADLVACTSDEVATELGARGIPADRLIVTPAGVDITRFAPEVEPAAVRRRHGLEGRPVVGWTGSFRRLHGLDVIIRAMVAVRRDHPDAVLLLVGDGNERPRLEALAAELDVEVVFTGTVPYAEVPAHITAMDVAVVSGSSEFHYSPLKLSEYLACGRAIVAPAVGHVQRLLSDGVDGVLVEAAAEQDLASAVTALLGDAPRRRALGEAARATAVRVCSWDQRVEAVLDRLGGGRPVGSAAP